MHIGETVENSWWLTGYETREQVEAIAIALKHSLTEETLKSGLYHGPVHGYNLEPGDPRTPDVPEHIMGPCVILLVAEAEVIGAIPPGMSSDLDMPSLEAMRDVTRKAYAERNPGALLTDMECDDVIDRIGENTVAGMVKEAVD